MNPHPRSPHPTAILTGTTASGKTALGIEFALAHPQAKIEIINADSMLVYRGMDIGTAKPSADERRGVPHHLIDICEPDQAFTAGTFVRETRRILQDIHSRGKRALILGGTGFYLKALLFGQWDAPASEPELRQKLEARTNEDLADELLGKDPEAAAKIGRSDRYRLIRSLEILELSGKTRAELQNQLPSEPDPDFALLVLDRPSSELEQRIAVRTRAMLDSGLLKEVENLAARFPRARSLDAVGYREAGRFLRGEQPPGRKAAPGLPGLADEINLATRQLVKAQRTWFKAQKTAEHFELDRDLPAILRRLEALYAAPY